MARDQAYPLGHRRYQQKTLSSRPLSAAGYHAVGIDKVIQTLFE